MTDDSQYGVSLDKVALLSVVNGIQRAKDAILSGDMETAEEEMDLAWTLLPNSVRSKFPDAPSATIEKRFAEETGTEAPPSTFLKLQSAFAYETERKRLRYKLAKKMLKEFSLQFIMELDGQGLYVSKDNYRFPKPTGTEPPTQTPPAVKKYGNLSREVSD
jgi:hypothetical protein